MVAKSRTDKSSGTTDAKTDTAEPAKKPQPDSLRETMESIAIAFVLAFLFKTFQAEIYVIPTGSMAPTLLGRHKDVHCDGCGYDFTVGASSEVDQGSGLLLDSQRIYAAVCPNCRRRAEILNSPAYNGDRILVNKQVPVYRRFDVVVFKNPEEGHVNYIKRLVGLPGETVRVLGGNIWARPNSDETARWQIQRKEDPAVQQDIQLVVYDDQYPPRALLDAGFPERWVPAEFSEADRRFGGWGETSNAWSADREARTFSAAADADWQWLRYRHIAPSQRDWADIEEPGEVLNAPHASLITDFCGFNTSSTTTAAIDYREDVFWVGDLTLAADITVRSADAEAALLLELIEGPRRFQCEIDLTSGEARLLATGIASRASATPQLMATGTTSISGTGTFEVGFANVDDRLLLWVDGDVVEFDSSTSYEDNQPDSPIATLEDLAPCGLAVRNADVTVSDLLVQRDIYYRNETYAFATADEESTEPTSLRMDHVREAGDDRREDLLRNSLDDPSRWSQKYLEFSSAQQERYGRFMEYRLNDGEYLMFGDNSPKSKDSRLFDLNSRPLAGVFSHRYAVREQDLIGRALFIFWPHAIPFLNGGEGFTVLNHKSGKGRVDDYPSVRFPFYPNFSRMKKIR